MPTDTEEEVVETQQSENVSEQVTAKTKEYAKKVVAKLKDLTNKFIPDYWEISETISEIHEKNIWQILGYETRDAFIEEFPLSKGSWYERKKLWETWCGPAIEGDHITRGRLNRMRSQNVKQLLRLNDKRMFHQKWIEWALNLTEKELEAKVDHACENATEPEEMTTESAALFKLRCSQSQKMMFLETLHEFSRRQEIPLDDEAHALEFILADYKSGWPESGKIIK